VREGAQLKLPWAPAGPPRKLPVGYPYERKDSFLTAAEISYYRILRMIFADQYLIFAQVRVLDLCTVLERQSNQAAFNRVDRKVVDFVLCHPRTFKPMVAIELDDSTHDRAYRHQRDVFLEEVFRVIGMKLVRQRVRLEYSVAEVTQRVEAALAAAA
jgi:very-short-patch-repair endonuclease